MVVSVKLGDLGLEFWWAEGLSSIGAEATGTDSGKICESRLEWDIDGGQECLTDPFLRSVCGLREHAMGKIQSRLL